MLLTKSWRLEQGGKRCFPALRQLDLHPPPHFVSWSSTFEPTYKVESFQHGCLVCIALVMAHSHEHCWDVATYARSTCPSSIV
jgi:hypothetical protein